MEFNCQEYSQFYWVVYFYVREKFFPNDSWQGLFPDKSPRMWGYSWNDKDGQLGKIVFKRGVRYFYLITTYFNDNVRVQNVDDNVVEIAFEIVGCNLSRRQVNGKTRQARNAARYEIFLDKKAQFLAVFPDLNFVIKINDDEIFKPDQISGDNGQIEESLLSLKKIAVDYFIAINAKRYEEAFEYWHIDARRMEFLDNSINLSLRYKFTQGLSKPIVVGTGAYHNVRENVEVRFIDLLYDEYTTSVDIPRIKKMNGRIDSQSFRYKIKFIRLFLSFCRVNAIDGLEFSNVFTTDYKDRLKFYLTRTNKQLSGLGHLTKVLVYRRSRVKFTLQDGRWAIYQIDNLLNNHEYPLTKFPKDIKEKDDFYLDSTSYYFE